MATRITEKPFDVAEYLNELADKIRNSDVVVISKPPRPDYNKFYVDYGHSTFEESGFYTLEFEVYEESRRFKGKKDVKTADKEETRRS